MRQKSERELSFFGQLTAKFVSLVQIIPKQKRSRKPSPFNWFLVDSAMSGKVIDLLMRKGAIKPKEKETERICSRLPVDLASSGTSLSTTEKCLLKRKALKQEVQKKKAAKFSSNCEAERSTKDGRNDDSAGIPSKTKLLPASWTSSLDSNGYVKVDLPSGSEEFVELVRIVPVIVKKIERIENVELYLRYQRQIAIVEKNCPTGLQIEKMLFHGTPSANIDSICEKGFEKKRIGQTTGNKGWFGSGIYFSPDFATSTHYCKNGSTAMLYCKVAVGESVIGTHSMPELPFKPNANGIRYDSAVNKLTNPTEIVIFEDSASYPAYLLYF